MSKIFQTTLIIQLLMIGKQLKAKNTLRASIHTVLIAVR